MFSIHPQTVLYNFFTLATQLGEDLALQAQAAAIIVPQVTFTQLKKKPQLYYSSSLN